VSAVRQTRVLVFTRVERLAITQVALLSVQTTLPDDEAVRDALRRSVTEWVSASETGRGVWQASCRDLNIGDLACNDAFADRQLIETLARHDLHEVALSEAGQVIDMSYDRVLVDEIELEGDDDDR
jgi:hypothetical protein